MTDPGLLTHFTHSQPTNTVSNFVTEMMTDTFTIERFTESDRDECMNVHIKSWSESYSELFPLDFIQSVERRRPTSWKEIAAAKNLTHWVGKMKGEIVGFVHLSPTNPNDGCIFELRALYLLDKAKGTGLAKALVHAAILDIAKDVNEPSVKIRVHCLTNNYRALNFYKGIGGIFQSNTILTKEYTVDGVAKSLLHDTSTLIIDYKLK
ncbi:hypothetical protein HDV02_003087 [Globomyces sp. JEL0801]|nr:hypothetical protein HDV02_003087 [Globomyces sp. JEL0801]